eukprot:UN25312
MCHLSFILRSAPLFKRTCTTLSRLPFEAMRSLKYEKSRVKTFNFMCHMSFASLLNVNTLTHTMYNVHFGKS